MIKFVFLNWKFEKYGNLYSTEIIEKGIVTGLIEKLKKIKNDYNLESVHSISRIFEVYQEIKLSEIIKFLGDSVTFCQINSDSDMDAYRRLLGPDLRHGPEIFREISEIADSLLTGGGKHDPVYLIREFLKNPWDGFSEICKRAIEEACDCLACSQNQNRDPTKIWCVGDFLEASGISTDGIDPEILSLKIYVYQDDGMGYGAINGPCICVDKHTDSKTGESTINIWM